MTSGSGRIEVVEGDGRIGAAEERAGEGHVEILLRTEVIAAVVEPGTGGDHCLTAKMGQSIVPNRRNL